MLGFTIRIPGTYFILYHESQSASRELKRAIVHVEAIHAIYPELVI